MVQRSGSHTDPDSSDQRGTGRTLLKRSLHRRPDGTIGVRVPLDELRVATDGTHCRGANRAERLLEERLVARLEVDAVEVLPHRGVVRQEACERKVFQN